MLHTAKETAGRTGARVLALYQEEARRALLLSAILRFLVIAIILALGVEPDEPAEVIFLDVATTAAFAPIGVLQLLMVWRRVAWAWPKYLFITVDVVMLAVVMLMPWPGDPALEHPALVSRDAVIAYSYVLLLLAILYLSAWAVAWFAVCSFLAWTVALGWLMQRPGVVTQEDMPSGLSEAERLAFALQPDYLVLDRWGNELVLLMVVALGTAAVVSRMRTIAMRAARIERRRGNLARYFSPTVLDDLEGRDRALQDGRQGEVAILFADLRDFSALTEGLPPTEVLALLRDFHGAMEAQVFAYGGSLEKYIGDALMASFGAPSAGPRDASQALCCARAMQSALDGLNVRRAGAGRPPIDMGIGLNFGAVVMGDIGSDRNMAFVTVVATVNLASRIQGLTRDLDCGLVISAAFAARVREEAGTAADLLLADFSRAREVRVKGFAHGVEVHYAPCPGDTLSGRARTLHTAGKGSQSRVIHIEGRAP